MKASQSFHTVSIEDDGSVSAIRPVKESDLWVNGGYFDPAFLPIGLRVIDATVVRPLIKARLITGVLFSAETTIGSDPVAVLNTAERLSAGRDGH